MTNSVTTIAPGIAKIRLYDANGDTSKTWYLDTYIIDPSSNSLIRKRIKGEINKFNTAAERYIYAERLKASLIQLAHEGYTFTTKPSEIVEEESINHAKLSLYEAFNLYLKHQQAKAEVKTLNRIKATQRYSAGFDLPPMAKIKSRHIEAILNHIQETRNISDKTYNHYRSVFFGLFAWYKRFEQISSNPVENIHTRTVLKGQANYPLTLDQIRQIKQLALRDADHQFILFINFCFYTLARPGKEIGLLRVGDINGNSLFIHPENSKTSQGRRVEIFPALKRAIEASGILAYPKHYYVFTAEGRPGMVPVGHKYFYKRQVKYLKELGLDGHGHTLYCYKHSGAIMMIDKGLKPIEVQHMAGHKSLKQTEEYLYHIGALNKIGDRANLIPDI